MTPKEYQMHRTTGFHSRWYRVPNRRARRGVSWTMTITIQRAKGEESPNARVKMEPAKRDEGIHQKHCLNTVYMYGQHFQQSMDQPGKVANPARNQLNRESCFFPVPVRA